MHKSMSLKYEPSPQLPDVDGLQHVSCTIHSADIHSLISSNISNKSISSNNISNNVVRT